MSTTSTAHPTDDRILDAVVATVVRHGIDGVSVRSVATAAGVSAGAVQHHFATKDALLQAAMDRVVALFREQAAELAARPGTPAARLRTFCHLLAGAPERGTSAARTAATVWLCFAAKACSSPTLARAHRTAWRAVELALAEQLAGVDGRTRDRDRAAGLLALLDGIAVARAAEPQRMPAARARRIVDARLTELGIGR